MKLITFGIILVTTNVALAKNFTLQYQGKVVKKEFCEKDAPNCISYNVDNHLNECIITLEVRAADKTGVNSRYPLRNRPVSWSIEQSRLVEASINIPGVSEAKGLQGFSERFKYQPPRGQDTLNALYVWEPESSYAYVSGKPNPFELYYNYSDDPDHVDHPINADNFYLYFYGSNDSGYRFKCDNLQRIN